ncbi:MAG TPA: hypothetical protein PLX81_00170, partial [Aliarcobacter cryaerophilus]|nr:hypothetical protein [Aliarcobacter cryaerophilus]
EEINNWLKSNKLEENLTSEQVINKFKEILNDTKGELPTFTKLVLDFGDIVSNNWYIILFFIIVLLMITKRQSD